jgi:hypothetical protein
MEQTSSPFSFESTGFRKHDPTPKKAAVLGTTSYLHDHHIRKTFSTTSMSLDELDIAGLRRTNLRDYIIAQTQVQVHVVERESLPVKTCKV